jgi:hypothetical protein
MPSEHAQILALLAAGRISVAEAERLLPLSSSFSGKLTGIKGLLLTWLPAAWTTAMVLLQHVGGTNQTVLEFLTIRALELTRLQHVFTFQMH